MNEENRPLVTDEPVEVQDFGNTTVHFRGICGLAVVSVILSQVSLPDTLSKLEESEHTLKKAQTEAPGINQTLSWDTISSHHPTSSLVVL